MIFVLLFYFAVVKLNIHNITVNLLQDSTAEFQHLMDWHCAALASVTVRLITFHTEVARRPAPDNTSTLSNPACVFHTLDDDDDDDDAICSISLTGVTV